MTHARPVLATVAVAACLPYLTLKLNWLSGGLTGIPEGSPLHDSGTAMWLLNALTAAMDGTVVLLVLALTRPWGRRLPAPVLTLPLWTACGLLGPIVVAFPVKALSGLLGGGTGGGDTDGADALLESWVWTVVYSGFVVQALALGGLFAVYVRDRWGTLLRSPLHRHVREGRSGGARAASGFAAAVAVSLPVLVAHAARLADEHADNRVTDATFLLYTVTALAAVARLLRAGGAERPGGARLWPTLAAAWLGSGVLACWGGWLLLGDLSGAGRALGQQTSGAALLTYACQALAGLLLAALAARQVHHRAHPPAAGAAAGAAVRG
ncbi:hypothetical protein [Streptomyces qinglanensis]|uniref:LigA protein n=1 Tax=Streptomyces qinglanensis TaxID=943816 RepID=A0A1H9N532_9ACTN|nr:hypothetical protein [Streptomyces qinglanensis]SER30523.1 hypothetical protein SAMN05421870_10170 [Streptomyces qinglanensis]